MSEATHMNTSNEWGHAYEYIKWVRPRIRIPTTYQQATEKACHRDARNQSRTWAARKRVLGDIWYPNNNRPMPYLPYNFVLVTNIYKHDRVLSRMCTICRSNRLIPPAKQIMTKYVSKTRVVSNWFTYLCLRNWIISDWIVSVWKGMCLAHQCKGPCACMWESVCARTR